MAGTTESHGLDFRFMYAVHDACRRDLDDLARTLDRPRTLDPVRIAAAQAGWQVLAAQLHLHHQSEDSGLWPRVRARLQRQPDELALLDAMEAEHGRIDPAITAVDAAFAERPDERPDALIEALVEARGHIFFHLAHEEQDALPLMNAVLPEADWKAFIADQRRENIRQAPTMFAWLISGTDERRAKEVLGILPPPLRPVVRRVWRPRYERRYGGWRPPALQTQPTR